MKERFPDDLVPAVVLNCGAAPSLCQPIGAEGLSLMLLGLAKCSVIVLHCYKKLLPVHDGKLILKRCLVSVVLSMRDSTVTAPCYNTFG